jgi:hypothetical protein
MLQISRTNGRLCLRAFILAMLAMLLLAAGAQADVPGAGGEAPEGQESGTVGVTEQQQPGEGGWEGGPEEAPQGTGGEGEVAPETPVGETSGETAGETAVGETPVETQPVPPSEPVEEVTPPPSETVQETPVGTLPLESAEKAPAGVTEEPALSKSTESTEEAASGGSPSHSSTLLAAADPSEPPARADALGEQAPSGPPATAAAITAQVAEVSGLEKGSAKAIPVRSAGSQAGRFRCELSALGGNMTDNCTAGWLGAPREGGSAPTSAAVTAVSSLAAAATANSPSGGGHGGSGLGGPPLTSAPGSAPGGSSGAAGGGGGGGGSGAGVSTFLTLAGLLLLAAPRALRRLRLSFEPWLAACFVLIPERPD